MASPVTSPSLRMPAAFRALPQHNETSGDNQNQNQIKENVTEDSEIISKDSSTLPSTPKQREGTIIDDQEIIVNTPLTENNISLAEPATPITSIRHSHSSPALSRSNDNSDHTADSGGGKNVTPNTRNSNESQSGAAKTSPAEDTNGKNTLKPTILKKKSQRSDITSVSGQETIQSERDRYGFKKTMGFDSIEAYNQWWTNYNPYLKRRKKKWIKLIEDSGGYLSVETDNENGVKTNSTVPTSFPIRSQKVKRYIRKGIPYEWRGKAWFQYAKADNALNNHKGFYENICEKIKNLKNNDTELIERDLHRTFPENIYFRNDSDRFVNHNEREETQHVQSLRRVLTAFAVTHPKIGYCQSLNFIAGVLLLFMNEEKAYWMLDVITKDYLPGVHEVNLEGVNIDQGVLMLYLRDNLPNIWEKLGISLDGQHYDDFLARLPPISLCTSAWFMSAFVTILPPETLLRVWDSMFYEGPKVLFRVSLAIFKLCESDIKGLSDQMEMFQNIQNFPKKLTNPNDFLEFCFRKIDPIKDGEVEKLRSFVSERRKLLSPENTDIDAFKSFRSKLEKSNNNGLSLNFHLKHQLRSITYRNHGTRNTTNNTSLTRRITSFQRKSISLRSSSASINS